MNTGEQIPEWTLTHVDLAAGPGPQEPSDDIPLGEPFRQARLFSHAQIRLVGLRGAAVRFRGDFGVATVDDVRLRDQQELKRLPGRARHGYHVVVHQRSTLRNEPNEEKVNNLYKICKLSTSGSLDGDLNHAQTL